MNSILQIASGTTAAFSSTGRAVGGFLSGFVSHSGDESVSSRRHSTTTFTDDADDEIERLRIEVEDHPRDGEVKQALRLAKLGQALFSRFEDRGDIEDLDEAIMYLSAAMDTVPSGHSHRLLYESNVGLLLCSRFEQRGDAADLEKAITYCQSALRAVSKTSSHRAWYEANYSTALLRRFEKTRSPDDLNKAIDLCSSAYHSLREGHEDRAMYAANMSSALMVRFEAKKSVVDLDEAISYSLAAVHATPSSAPLWASYQSALSAQLFRRFQEHGDPADLDQSIDRSHAAIDALPSNHSDRSVYQANLSTKLIARYEKYGKVADLDEAIFLAENAASQPNSRSQAVVEDPKRYATLSRSLLRRFESTGFVADLDKAISHDRYALKTIPSELRASERPVYLNNLSNKLFKRFERFGELSDLDEAVAHGKSALEMTPQDHSERVSRLVGTSHKLVARFEWTGHEDDIREAVLFAQAALDLAPMEQINGPMIRYNLAAILLRQYQHKQEGVDLDAVVSLARAAWQATIVDQIHRNLYESLLAAALYARFQRHGHAVDLHDAISHAEAVVRASPRSDVNFAMYRSILSAAILSRFQLTNEGVDSLDDAIDHGREALQHTLEDHPKWCKIQYKLGQALLLRFERKDSNNELDLEDAISCFRRASSSPVGAPTSRFQAALMWAGIARKHSRLQAALQGYEAALQLIPQVTWIGLGIPNQQPSLSKLALDLTTDGVACALELKQLETAVEFLENARQMVRSHSLRVRTELDAARTADPTVFGELSDIWSTLERDGHEHNFSFAVLTLEVESVLDQPQVPSPISLTPTRSLTPTTINVSTSERKKSIGSLPTLLDKKATSNSSAHRSPVDQELFGKRYRRMADKWDQLIGSIRRIEGLANFLRPKSFAELRKIAEAGPVVSLTCNRHRCDALIIASNRSSVDLVPLTDISSRDVEKWSEDLLNGIRDTSLGTLGGTEFERYTLKPILRDLWEYVLLPVLDKLDTISPSLTSTPRRIWFCPTSAFTALPIHAAGPHLRGQDGLQNRFNPSYTPTLTALLRARSPRSSRPFQILTVSQPSPPGEKPLLGASRQVRFIRELASPSSLSLNPLEGKGATIQAVSRALTQPSFVHLACHVQEDRQNPTRSAILLADGALHVEDMASDSLLPRIDFAFFTGSGDPSPAARSLTRQEEVTSMASSLQFMGLRSTISMLWEPVDGSDDTALVVKEVYTYLFRQAGGRGPVASDAGEALARALRTLTPKIPLHRRVAFTHIGL